MESAWKKDIIHHSTSSLLFGLQDSGVTAAARQQKIEEERAAFQQQIQVSTRSHSLCR